MKYEIELSDREIKDLKLIRNYFGENDKTGLEHLAYNELDKLIGKLFKPDIVDCKICNDTGFRNVRKAGKKIIITRCDCSK